MTTICIDCRYIADRPSGISEVVRGLVDFAPALAPDLEFLLLRNPAHPGRLSSAPNVRECVVPQAANGPATMWYLPRVVDLDGVDLFHATFNIMPAGLPMPCVTTIHDLMWLENPQWCRTGLRGRVERAFYAHGIGRALRRSAAIATVSKASADAVALAAPQAAARTCVTLSGVSPRFAPTAASALDIAFPGAPPGKRFVLTVGQYAPYKNHEGAIRAFALAFTDRRDIDLVLVQRMGPRSRHLLALAAELGIDGRVHLLPAVAPETLVGLYSTASALLHPSFCEGFGNPVAEAMACGCPVVTSDLSAMPEVTAGAALLADPHDLAAIAVHLKAVVDDPALATTMRRKGLERASQLTWQAFAAANVAIYRAVLATPSRPISSITLPAPASARTIDRASTKFSTTAS